jgi:antitoxin HigA-1
MIPTDREPTHPGEMLIEEFLQPLGLTQVAAAKKMGIPLNRLNEIIRGKRGITADTAIRLATLLGTSPELWMNLQSIWDIYHAAKSLHVSLETVRGFPEPSTTEEVCESLTAPWSFSFLTTPVELGSAAKETVVAASDSALELAA